MMFQVDPQALVLVVVAVAFARVVCVSVRCLTRRKD